MSVSSLFIFKTSIFSARVRHFSRYEASPHIPEHYPFRVQTKPIHIILYTLSPSLPVPTRTSHPCHHHIPFLRSTCPNHLNLPCLTTSAPLSTSERLYKSTLAHCASYPSATPRTSISPSSVPSSREFADLLSSSVLYVNTLWTQALYIFPFL